ncbi:WD40-repeat containing protein [Chondrus crispus]|uniref:WD40-repeat containing protein n=1 Tax=Chondrus crispus TaxID=2769 RepID=R7QKT4_CHOCR|nr:WD40-repeat containing protein [Chondrus crispus]CDF38694.1 WD40-repeat containing protein [Chondrus crispus]|eukprot:XP_005718599.1 WD40-repeat containing protein [Chondrus crispus]
MQESFQQEAGSSRKRRKIQSPDVFISHAGPDKLLIARPLSEKLQAHGLNCFLDKTSMEPGDCGEDEMTQAMESAKVGVFILSPEFAARKWTMRELRCFLHRRKEAISSGMRPPTLIPVFYRLSIRECRELDPNRYRDDEGKNLFQVEKFFSVERQLEASTATVKRELQELAGITGIENDERATNLLEDEFGHDAREHLVKRVSRWVKKKSDEQEADRLHDGVQQVGATVESIRGGRGDVFRPSIRAEHNVVSICMTLDSRGNDGLPNTCESRLKAAVLRRDRNEQVGATAVGQGGVGKTCALRAIAHDVEIKAEFSGGVYFMSLGKDGNVGGLIEELCLIVEASGGNQTAAKMREESDFRRVLAKVQAWFCSHVCLFIIDDVWVVNDIEANILQKLSVLADTAGGSGERRSRLMYSTRDRGLRQLGERIAFEPRETEGKEAVDMLVHASGANRGEVEDARCKEAVSEILGMCGGLPLALNVAGTSVRYMRERWEEEVSEAWGDYLSKMKRRNTIRRESPKDGYSSLDGALRTSLDILESDVGRSGEAVGDISFRKIHRSLCVMKKQDRIPLSLVGDLWELDEVKTEWYAKEMERVGLVELQYKKGCGGLRVHDLTHDFAVQEAQKEESVTFWYKKLAGVCRQGRGLLAITESEGRESKDAREKYVFENIYRVLRQGGCVEELKNLFLKARWVKTVIQRGSVWQYEEAVKDLNILLRNTGGSESLLRDTGEEDSVYAMELMMRAARLSVPFRGEGSAGIYFQLYGRIKHRAQDSGCVQRMLKEIERHAPRPWVRPVGECVERADGRLVEQIVLPYAKGVIQVGMDSSGEVYGCQVEFSGAEVTVFRQSAEKETKMVRLQGEFETESQSPGDVEARSVTSEVIGKKRSVTRASCATFCERKGYVVVGYEDGTLRLWSTSEKKVLRSFHGHRSEVRCVAMSGDGKRVASGSKDKSVRVWDVETGAQVGEALVGHTDWVYSVAMSEDGRRVVSGSCDESVRLWDVETGAQVGEALVGHTDFVLCVAMSEDGRRVVSGSCDNSVRVWDVETGAQVGEALVGHTDWVRSVAMSGDGRRVASGSFDKSVRVWDVETGAQVGEALVGHMSPVQRVAMSGDGRRVASGSFDKSVRVWDVETGAQVGEALVGHTREVNSVAMSGDGRRVVSGSEDMSVRVWDVETGAQVGEALVGHTGYVYSVAMSGDGRRVVSGSCDTSVRVWDVETGERVGDALIGHTLAVVSVAMSGDGRRVVSGSLDTSVRVWDVETGAQVGDALVGHTDSLLCVAMSEDGRRVVSGSDDKSVRVWDVERGITLYTGRVEDLGEIESRFLTTPDLGTAPHAGRRSQIFSKKGGIIQRREDGSEAVLAQLDGPKDLQIDHDHGVVVGRLGHLVAIMKLVV